MKFTHFIFLFTIALALLIEPAIAADQIIALKAARLFDGKSRTLTQNGVVLVQGDKITDAGANVAVRRARR
jgi:imidazolonepropionase-like amidohydrolase